MIGKSTNPKDAIGRTKTPLSLLSPIAKAAWALAQFAGMAKYGHYNWRISGVRASIYLDAIDRHRDAYLSGEERDPVDGTHHLGNIMACCAIILDAAAAGKLVDDRPPSVSIRPTYAACETQMAVLREKYKDANPRHYTIADTEREADGKPARPVLMGDELVHPSGANHTATRDFEDHLACGMRIGGWAHADGAPIGDPPPKPKIAKLPEKWSDWPADPPKSGAV